MRATLERLIAHLPFDSRSRRALDETFCDWAHEQAAAAGTLRSWAMNARGLLSLTRVVVMSSVAEVRRVPAGWLAIGITVTLLAPAAAITAINFPWRVYGQQFLPPTVAETYLMLTLPMVGFLAPAGFFLLAAWSSRKRPLPAVGLALIAICVIVMWEGVVTPTANQRFRVLIYEALTGANWEQSPGMARGLAEFTWPDLILRAAGPPAHLPALGMGALKVATAAAAATFVLLGAAISRRSLRTKILWSCAIATFVAVVEPMLSAALRSVGIRPGLFASALAVWTMAAAGLVIALRLGTSAR